MRVEFYTDAAAFYENAIAFLTEKEIRNSLFIGIVAKGCAGADISDWLMVMVRGAAGNIQLVGIMTPPRGLVLAVGRELAQVHLSIELLAVEIQNKEISVPGVTAEEWATELFTKAYMGEVITPMKRLGAHQLLHVADVPYIGTMRRASKRDLHFLPYWMQTMSVECHEPLTSITEKQMWASQLIEKQHFFILEDAGMPVAMAAVNRVLPSGAVNFSNVYTPPYYRGQGYATALVAQASEAMLKCGAPMCALYTDMSNGAANHIYQRIGYERIGELVEVSYE